MNLMRIKYFVEVAKWGSFSKAAQTLYVSQPNLSRQIALMEQEVGFELFQRSGKRIQLTRAGEYLYSQLREVPEHIERAVAHAEVISRREADSLSIGVLEGQDVNLFLSQRINKLREKDPKLLIEMERNSSLRIIDIPESRAAGLVAVWRKDNHNPLIPVLIKSLTE